jgi:hypothetical protein
MKTVTDIIFLQRTDETGKNMLKKYKYELKTQSAALKTFEK